MDIANVLAAFSGGVGGGLYAAQVIKRKVSKLELDFSMQDSAIRLLNQEITKLTEDCRGMLLETRKRYESHALLVSAELNKMQNKLNSIPRRKK